MGNFVFFHHRDAGFDCQLLGLAEMLSPVAGGQSVLRTDFAVATEGHGHAPPTLFRPRYQQQCDRLIGQKMPFC